jgi:sporulation protein YlmC with PRC-barrel domain
MISENSRLRSEFLNTQVITRNTGRKLGVVKEILVDIDRREVVVLGLRDSIFSLSGMPRYMYLSSVSQTGDVILVEDDEVIESVDIDAYTPVIGAEVITETGEPIGRVRDYQFDSLSGKLATITIASIGLPQIPETLISTYELSIEEVVSSGPNRLIVFEGAEERLTQISVGVLERLGIGRPPWEKDEEEVYYPPTARPENQLGTGIPLRTPVEAARPSEEGWSDDEWEPEPLRRADPLPRRRTEALRQEDEEEDNWGEARGERVEDRRYELEETPGDDVWDDDIEPERDPQRLNIVERKRIPEYEEG